MNINKPWPSDDLLDFVRLQETSKISSGHDWLRQVVVALELGLLAPGAVQSVQSLDGRFRPDAEASDVATRSQLLQVQFVNGQAFDARDVAEGLGKTLVLGVDDKRTKLVGAAAVAHLTLTSAEAA